MKIVACVFLTALALVHGSDWSEEKCLRPCPRDYAAHCLTFQKTVPNKCAGDIESCKMRAQGYSVISSSDKGCECSPICTADYNPVCAVNLNSKQKKVYGNPCELDNAVCQGARLGEMDLKSCEPVPELFD
nr:venom-related protein Kazal protease inhibitor [Conus judaeus]